ncbi:coiled-coil domain-containing protein 22 homolog [Patella vulgata]|uniref:coiled-coil domain-containing protein 22 homolog n=1 Tax=Patella vulgata TaxID=6465 RepID=UPI0024A83E8F|nr:coiled-coil domain-containing protein 22 homolog [Patella vulgata]
MEEVDNIIIHSLRSIGCELDDDLSNLKQFSTEVIVATIVKCIKFIKNDVELPSTLPPGMSARFRIGASLANHIQDMGYNGEIGYQTFLYSNETEIRKVFMFLVEKLPKDTTQTSDEPLGASVLLQRAIAAKLHQQMTSPWTPHYLKDRGITWRGKPPSWQREGAACIYSYRSQHLSRPEGLTDLTRKIPKEIRNYYSTSLPFVTNQCRHHRDTLASVIESNTAEVAKQQEWENEWNHSGLASRLSKQEFIDKKKSKIQKMIADRLRQDAKRETSGTSSLSDLQQVMAAISSRAKTDARTKGSRFAHSEKLLFSKDEDASLAQMSGEIPTKDTEEEQERKREEEMQSLRDELGELTSKLESLELEIKKYSATQQQLEEAINTENRQIDDKESSFNVKKKTMDLLPDAENNILKLQGVVETSTQRLVTLANKWETHRAPLIQQYRELKTLTSQKESEAEKKLAEIRVFRDKMKEVADEVRNKEDLQKQLQSEYERMTKDVNRSAYTRKILEIVANIKKQKQEIDKVLVDTKSIQKEINSLSGKLDRTFTVTDELIFRDAKKDEAVKKAYRFLAALHENCELLISTVEETGVIMREIRDLEDQIENESGKKVLANLEKITQDYQEMKKENSVLMSKLKQKQ